MNEIAFIIFPNWCVTALTNLILTIDTKSAPNAPYVDDETPGFSFSLDGRKG
jgi:hypothetical protein